ncbi:FxSxx-COOH system tetratricopeptide repeat protein [Sphaerisporangium aureirubrum]|uniref:FxSxx-COOH system tetratricopeptide repeat protein n=1 Tax=Sphaerisporangium aureirubrum TaxID=1544736 RepID=A0ABW1NJX9_9ACTN
MADDPSGDRAEVHASAERAVAAARISGVVTTGDHSPVDNRTVSVAAGTPRAPGEVELPAALNNLPDAPGAVFVGRAPALAQLGAELSGDEARVVISQVIHGLGGVGKTELARQYATRNRGRYRLIWWITAETPEQIQAGLAKLAERLHPPVRLVLTAEQSADWARAWLQAHDDWLLVLDNVEQPAHVRSLLGQLYDGHILITTRRRVSWPGRVRPIGLDVLDPDAAVALITAAGDRDRQDERSDVASIAEELGYLPLALEQAGAYLRESKISPSEYLGLLRRHPAHMYDASAEGGDAERTIARLWRAHIGAVLLGSTQAVSLLWVLSCYDPDDIPRSILSVGTDDVNTVDALRLLSSYSMITLGEETVSMHRLVQAAVREHMSGVTSPEEHPAPAAALAALISAWLTAPLDALHETTPIRRTLAAHLDALISRWPNRNECPGYDLVVHYAARHESDQGNYHRAHRLITHAVSIRTATLGAEDVHTLGSRCERAKIAQNLGLAREAEAEQREVLHACRRLLGEEHPDTLIVRGSLALVLRDLGRLEESEAEHRAVLRVRHRLLGEEHPATLISRNNLALVLQDLGRPSEAERELGVVLAAQRRVLGEEHRDTLTSRGALALVFRDLGRPAEAEAELRAVLEAQCRTLGEEHPSTLISRGNLASVLGSLGRPAEAEAGHRAVSGVLRRVLGAEHPHTLTCRANLANALRALGRPVEAEAELRAVLEVELRTLGEEHRSTLICRGNLASVLEDQGRLAEAEAENRAVLEGFRRTLGEEHPHTLTCRNNLAGVLRALGRAEEGEEL